MKDAISGHGRRVRHLYRATGADLPFGDPRRAHGVAMEGYFWRFTDASSGRVIVALCGVNRSRRGPWATVALGAHPQGFQREADVRPGFADPARLGVRAGDGAFSAGPDSVRVSLSTDTRLDVALDERVPWPRRSFGGLGPAQTVPGLGQYWHPHLLGGVARGTAMLGGEEVDLDGFQVYAEKNWGAGGFPEHWWWGQAQGFARHDACVAFAGGDVRLGPLSMRATALVVRFGETLVALGHPLTSPVAAEAQDDRWRLRGHSAGWSVEVDGRATPGDAHVLPVPLPSEGHSVPGALEHLAGTLRVVVRRRGRLVFEDESTLAGLETGGVAGVVAELARRGVEAHAQ
jgi:hypothetical protein